MDKELTIIGSELFAKRLAKALLVHDVKCKVVTRSEWSTLNHFKKFSLYLRSNKILHVYSVTKPKYLIIAKIFGNKIYNYWIGSDVIHDLKRPLQSKFALKLFSDYFADGKMIIKELETIGISPKYIPNPFAIINTGPIPILPNKFTILIYLPAHRNDCNAELMKEVALSLPEINFQVVGDSGDIFSLPNVQFNGYTNVSELYPEISCLLRTLDHDSLSTMVIEALSYGRHVIWNNKFDFCQYATNKNEIMDKIFILKKENQLNKNAVEFVRNNFNSEKIVKKIYDSIF